MVFEARKLFIGQKRRVPPAGGYNVFTIYSYPALRAKGGRCVLGYLVAVPRGGTRFCVVRSAMAR